MQQPQMEAAPSNEQMIREVIQCTDTNQLTGVITEIQVCNECNEIINTNDFKQKLIREDRDKAKELLESNPELSYGLLEALHVLQLIDKETYDHLTN